MDPRWFWQAYFDNGNGTKVSHAFFYADDKGLARDHARTLAQDFGKSRVVRVVRVMHAKDVSPEANAVAGVERFS